MKDYEKTVSQQINAAKIDGFNIVSKATKIAVQQINVYDQGLGVILKLDETFEATMTAINF